MPQLRGTGFEVCGVPAADDDAGSKATETFRDGEADARAASSHDRDPILQHRGTKHDQSDYHSRRPERGAAESKGARIRGGSPSRMDHAPATSTSTPAAETFARLFEAVHEGVYIGVVDAAGNATLFANPFLKLMFGFAADADPVEVRPFDPDRFVDPQAREQFLDRLQRDGA